MRRQRRDAQRRTVAESTEEVFGARSPAPALWAEVEGATTRQRAEQPGAGVMVSSQKARQLST